MKQLVTPALLVRSIPYGEADLVVTLMTEAIGKVGALVRGGRRSSRRMGGALEPFHTIEVTLDDRGGDLVALREARLLCIRAGVVSRLESVEAAGAALRWARHIAPIRTPEGAAYVTLVELLDALDALPAPPASGAPPAEAPEPVVHPRALLAGAGLRLLANIGYALEFDRCVRCSKACPPERPACIDAARGGLVCTACGGAARVFDAELRGIARALQAGRQAHVAPSQASDLLVVVEQAMTAHTGFDG